MEARHLSTDHTQAGRRLAQDWGLPAPFVKTIAHHHYPEKAAGHIDLVHLVYIADLLMSAFHAGYELERVNIDHLDQRRLQVGLARRDLPEIVDSPPATIFNPTPPGPDNA